MLAGIRTELSQGSLTLTGHDLELTISVTISEGVSGDTDGVAVLPARLVSDVVKALLVGAATLLTRDDVMNRILPRSKPAAGGERG